MLCEKRKIIDEFDKACTTIGIENATSNALEEIFDYFERELDKIKENNN